MFRKFRSAKGKDKGATGTPKPLTYEEKLKDFFCKEIEHCDKIDSEKGKGKGKNKLNANDKKGTGKGKGKGKDKNDDELSCMAGIFETLFSLKNPEKYSLTAGEQESFSKSITQDILKKYNVKTAVDLIGYLKQNCKDSIDDNKAEDFRKASKIVRDNIVNSLKTANKIDCNKGKGKGKGKISFKKKFKKKNKKRNK